MTNDELNAVVGSAVISSSTRQKEDDSLGRNDALEGTRDDEEKQRGKDLRGFHTLKSSIAVKTSQALDRGRVLCDDSIEIEIVGQTLSLTLIMEEDALAPLFSGACWAGTIVWDASLLTCEILELVEKENLPEAKVVELGCGIGVPGMVARFLGADVILTEQEELLPLLHKNIETNFSTAKLSTTTTGPSGSPSTTIAGTISAEELYWSTKDATVFQQKHGRLDYILCSDCVYEPLYGDSWKALVVTLTELSDIETITYVVLERRTADGIDKFLAEVKKFFSVELVISRGVVDAYRLTLISSPPPHTVES